MKYIKTLYKQSVEFFNVVVHIILNLLQRVNGTSINLTIHLRTWNLACKNY
jgi:hypothetical protein